MADKTKNPKDWITIHNPNVDGPDSRVQRKSFDAVWGVPTADGGPGFKEGPRKKVGN